MADLDSLKASLNSYRRQLANKKAEKQKYLGIAADIDAIYDRMAADKRTIKTYRDSVNSFYKEKYDTFRGNMYSSKYKQSMKELVSSYDDVIRNIDTNMDRLNTLKANYENKAYQCNGVIGYLQSSINTVVHTIENWVN